MDRRLHVLAPLFAPLDRPVELEREVAEQRLLGIDVELAAEPPADVRRDHTHLALGEIEQLGKMGFQNMRYLSRRPDREFLFSGKIAGHYAARLDGVGCQALVHQFLLDDFVRLLESFFDVALLVLPAKGHIVGPFGVDHWGAGRERFFRVSNRRQRLVLHVDQVERVARRIAIFGDNRRHSVAHVTDLVDRQDVMLGNSQSRVAGGGRQSADLIAQLRAGENRDNAGMAPRRVRVEAFDLGMRVRASKYRHVEHARKPDIVHVLAEPANQTRIFAPLNPGTDGFAYWHRVSKFWITIAYCLLLFLLAFCVICFAAICTASTICWYPVQRQRFPSRAWRISASVGCGFRLSSWYADRIIPGVQKPHWSPWHSQKASWSG